MNWVIVKSDRQGRHRVTFTSRARAIKEARQAFKTGRYYAVEAFCELYENQRPKEYFRVLKGGLIY